MRKGAFSAILFTIITVLLVAAGIAAYASGQYAVEYFGIRLSRGAFTAIIAAFVAIDVITFLGPVLHRRSRGKDESEPKGH